MLILQMTIWKYTYALGYVDKQAHCTLQDFDFE